jgi:hypothetical protein
MKVKLLIGVLLAFFALSATSAQADRWYVSRSQAKRETREFARQVCARLPRCQSYGVGECLRQSSSRFVCIMGLFYPTYGGEEECDEAIHWGVDPEGYLEVRHLGRVHCYYI